jgi:hypothetical protein
MKLTINDRNAFKEVLAGKTSYHAVEVSANYKPTGGLGRGATGKKATIILKNGLLSVWRDNRQNSNRHEVLHEVEVNEHTFFNEISSLTF